MRVNVSRIHHIWVKIYCWWLNRVTASAVTDEEYCQWETFRPRCLPGETIIISKAIYGRMSDTGRCLQDEDWEEAVLPALQKQQRYLGCFEDVLPLVRARCSGHTNCEIRIPDPEMEKTSPCYRYLDKYLKLAYHCVSGMILYSVHYKSSGFLHM